MPNKKVLMVIAHQFFRDEEYFEPKEVFEDNGIKVVTASSETGTAIGKLGREARVDVLLDDIDIKPYCAIIFVGGPGCKEFWDDLEAHRIIREVFEDGKIVAAICSATVILARAGILDGKYATCFKGDSEEITKTGAIYTGNSVEQNGMIITADGPASALEFGTKIVDTIRNTSFI